MRSETPASAKVAISARQRAAASTMCMARAAPGDLRLDPRSNNETIAADAFVPAPTIGIGAYGRISKRWSWEVELFGFGISIDTFGISIIDARLAIGYNVSDAIVLRLGYRATALSILVDGYEVDVSMDGGFFELRWSF